MGRLELRVGDKLPAKVFRVTRADLVRYAGASGDFNRIHWSDRFATEVGLPGVIAHGMYTMALAGRAVSEWLDDPAPVVDFGVRFTRPVVVPDDDEGAEVTIAAQVKAGPDDDHLVLDITATCGAEKVLGLARATVRR
jgi:acyl dehydratase